MLISTLKVILSAIESSSFDESRRSLNCVNVRKLTDKKLEIIACDGYKLFKREVEDEDLFYQIDKEYINIRNTNKNILKEVLKNKKMGSLAITIDDDNLNVTNSDIKVSLSLYQGDYVGYSMIDTLFSNKYNSNKIHFNVELLKDLLKSFDQIGNSKSFITLEIPEDTLKPIKVYPYQPENNSLGVLMPMKGK